MSPVARHLIAAAVGLTAAVAVSAGVRPQLTLPLDIPPALSASFAELRPRHYHGGIDFKTGGREGLAVSAVASGYVSRVAFTPREGYGRVVYVTHPYTGLVTVYAHLSGFSPAIDSLLKDMGYDPAGRLDVALLPWELPVAQGEQIALSGNTGHSFGPHLHFETRSLLTGDALDPLDLFSSSVIPDSTAPLIRGIALYDAFTARRFATINLDADLPVVTAWGELYPAILANDRIDGQINRLGAKHIRLTLDGRLLWAKDMLRYHPDDTAWIDRLVPEPERMAMDGWWEWTRLPADCPLQPFVYATTAPEGRLSITEERDYRLEYVVSDAYGNTVRKAFIIRGLRPHNAS